MRDAKRARLQFDGQESSSSEECETKSDSPGSVVDDRPAGAVLWPPIPRPSLDAVTISGEEEQSEDDPFVRELKEWDPSWGDGTIVDYDDNSNEPTVRCKQCGHEIWAVWMTQRGFCTGCENGQEEEPYFEIIDPEAGPRAEIEAGEYANSLGRADDRRNIVGDYLDEEYDTQDEYSENSPFKEDYDLEDSFIDDDSIDERQHEDNEASSSDDEDYEQLFKNLQTTHDRLVADYCELVERHDGIMRDLMGSEYDSDELNISDMNEEGALMVSVINPDPVVAEIVLSQAQEQSQESEISDDRLKDRAKAFQAVEDGQAWPNVTLVSTGDNHTHEETEL